MRTQQNAPQSLPGGLKQAIILGSKSRRDALNLVAKTWEARLAALSAEQARLALKYGARSSRAKGAQIRLDMHQALKAEILAELTRTAIRTPNPVQNQFIVYGRVLDKTGNGVPKVMLAAVDANGGQLVEAITDASGEFELDVLAPAGLEAGATFTFKVIVANARMAAETFNVPAGGLAYREYVITRPQGKTMPNPC